MKKRITILKRDFLERGKRNYFNKKSDIKILFDMRDKQLNNKINELNKTYRSNFYEILEDFNTKTKKGQDEFVKFFIDYKKIFDCWDLDELKKIVVEIIQKMK